VSLILDALRKADSERERESVPGLHTQPVPPLSLEMPAHVRPRPWLWILAGVGVGLLLVAAAWYFVGREAPRPPVVRTAPEPLATAAAPSPTVAPNAITAEPPREIAAPAPWPAENRKGSTKSAVKADAPAVAATTGIPAVYAREQLPDNIRAALPPLAVGGSIFSSTPANRSLILDGRLYRENDQLSAELLLEEIGQKTAVLRFKGYRFEIRY
jgi:general secretion pathway protein B